jgi:hypothetical protein
MAIFSITQNKNNYEQVIMTIIGGYIGGLEFIRI